MNDKRVLVISHNAFGKVNNMGRTMEAAFRGWDPQCIAQIYFLDEQPASAVCTHFFQVTDTDVLKSLLSRRAGGRTVSAVKVTDALQEKSAGWKTTIIKAARYRTPLVYCTRNLLWKLGEWKSAALWSFLDDFKPEAVFYASGDYAFSYEVALTIMKDRNIPLIIGCYDDFYIGKRQTINPLYWINRRNLLSKAEKAFTYAKAFVAVCDLMTRDYEKRFHKPGVTLYTATGLIPKNCEKAPRIIYTGNLGYGRAEQLAALGRAVKDLPFDCPPHHIDVYSAEIRTEIIGQMNESNGICFHGRISPEEVADVICYSTLLIHVESFEPEFEQRVRYSISTKIADCLASGTCILAYGPTTVASIQYLKDNQAAYVINSPSELNSGLQKLLYNAKLRQEIIENALNLAKRNHNQKSNQEKVRTIINGK